MGVTLLTILLNSIIKVEEKVMRTKTKVVCWCTVTAVVLITGTIGLMVGNKTGALRNAASRAKDIFVAIVAASSMIEFPATSLWPKVNPLLKTMGEQADAYIAEITFENSSDYFSVLLDGENMGNPQIWSPYVIGLDWSSFAGGGVPPKVGAGRLTAENNIWTIAANIEDDMPDDIPIIVSRNVDPASLIPGEGDISQQRVRPSGTVTTPFGDAGFVFVQKGGKVVIGSWKKAELHSLYQTDIQKVRTAFQTVKYLTP